MIPVLQVAPNDAEKEKKRLSEQIEETAVNLLATIQELQERESEDLLHSLNDMGVGQLSEVSGSLSRAGRLMNDNNHRIGHDSDGEDRKFVGTRFL